MAIFSEKKGARGMCKNCFPKSFWLELFDEMKIREKLHKKHTKPEESIGVTFEVQRIVNRTSLVEKPFFTKTNAQISTELVPCEIATVESSGKCSKHEKLSSERPQKDTVLLNELATGRGTKVVINGHS